MTLTLICDQCGTSYAVNQAAIPVEGRVVRCIKCGHTWQYTPPNTQENPTQSTVATNNANVFAGKSSRPSSNAATQKAFSREVPVIPEMVAPLWLKLLTLILVPLEIVLFFLVMGDWVIEKVPSFTPLYHSIGMFRSEGVILKGVQIKKELLEDSEHLVISGKIVNTMADARTLPRLRIALLDKDKKEIASHTLRSSGKKLKPQEEYVMSNKITRIPSSAEYLGLDIGGKMELVLR